MDNRDQALRRAALVHERWQWVFVSICLFALTIGALWTRVFITVSAGHRGVMFYRLSGGTQIDRSLDEGFYVIAPWNQLTSYEIRLQTRTLQLNLPSEEGLEMSVSVALRYRPYAPNLGYLHRDIGPDYFERLILPEVQGHLRKVLGKKKAQDIYTGAREILDEMANVPVLGRLRKEWHPGEPPPSQPTSEPYILLEELRVLDIARPAVVANAVNEKLRQEQLSLEYKHRLQREEQEAERKRAEAAGIRDFAQVSGIDIVRWRNIEATLELARSNNAKVIVLGNGQATLPMMLNMTEDGAKSDGPVTAAARGVAPPKTPAFQPPKPKPPEPTNQVAPARP